MIELFKKLNYKLVECVHFADLPEELESLPSYFETITDGANDDLEEIDAKIGFLMYFTKTRTNTEGFKYYVDRLCEDALVWMCYPKGTSKKYTCDFNRDNGWEVLGRYGYEPVKMVSINEDWSALRFRKVAFIKKMNRSFALTDEGKQKVKSGK